MVAAEEALEAVLDEVGVGGPAPTRGPARPPRERHKQAKREDQRKLGLLRGEATKLWRDGLSWTEIGSRIGRTPELAEDLNHLKLWELLELSASAVAELLAAPTVRNRSDPTSPP